MAFTKQVIPLEIVEVIDDDKGSVKRIMIAFSKPLVNPFDSGVFGKKDKLDELHNYYIDPNDEAGINKARFKKPIFCVLDGFSTIHGNKFQPFSFFLCKVFTFDANSLFLSFLVCFASIDQRYYQPIS